MLREYILFLNAKSKLSTHNRQAVNKKNLGKKDLTVLNHVYHFQTLFVSYQYESV